MDPRDSSQQNDHENDQLQLLQEKLAETEDKLVKFKKFVVTLRNERTQLQEQVRYSFLNCWHQLTFVIVFSE